MKIPAALYGTEAEVARRIRSWLKEFARTGQVDFGAEWIELVEFDGKVLMNKSLFGGKEQLIRAYAPFLTEHKSPWGAYWLPANYWAQMLGEEWGGLLLLGGDAQHVSRSGWCHSILIDWMWRNFGELALCNSRFLGLSGRPGGMVSDSMGLLAALTYFGDPLPWWTNMGVDDMREKLQALTASEVWARRPMPPRESGVDDWGTIVCAYDGEPVRDGVPKWSGPGYRRKPTEASESGAAPCVAGGPDEGWES